MSWSENNEWLKPSKREALDLRMLGRFVALFGTSRLALPGLALLGIGGASCVWFIPGVVATIGDALRAGDTRTALWALAALAGISAAQAITAALVRLGGAYVSTRANARIVTVFFERVLGARVDAYLLFRRRTNMFQRVIDALGITREFTDTALQAGIILLMLPIYLTVMFRLSPGAGTAMLVVWFVIAATASLFGTRLRMLRRTTLAVGYPLVEKMLEILEGLLTIKALSGSVRITQDVADLVATKREAERAELTTESVAGAITQLWAAVGVSVCVGGAALGSPGATVTAGTLVSVWLIATFAVPLAAQAVQYVQSLQVVTGNIEALFETLALEQETSTSAASVAVAAAPLALVRAGAGAQARRALPAGGVFIADDDEDDGDADMPEDDAVAFDGVGFSYPGGEEILRDVSFRIATGEHVCIVGPSGAGKTTLFRLLLGFMPPGSGTITVQGETLTRATDLAAHRRRFGVVSQRDFFFGISLLDNLAFGLAEAPSRERIMQVLEHVGLAERVDALPRGLDHRYGANQFSGGEEQRFFVARALLRQPAIVLLDEPTSALDFENEERVLDALAALSASRTTLTIAHRLSTVRAADRILVLAEGTVVGDGTHDALLETSQYYRELCAFNSFLLS